MGYQNVKNLGDQNTVARTEAAVEAHFSFIEKRRERNEVSQQIRWYKILLMNPKGKKG